MSHNLLHLIIATSLTFYYRPFFNNTSNNNDRYITKEEIEMACIRELSSISSFNIKTSSNSFPRLESSRKRVERGGELVAPK